jgi:hypothetical protein
LEALPKLQKNIVLSSNNSSGLWEVISPEITIVIRLQLLGLGASYIILTIAYRASESSVFVVRNLFVNAANSCEELKIAFPDGKVDLNTLQNEYQAKSVHGLKRGYVGCTNRLLIEIKHPSKKKYGNASNSH